MNGIETSNSETNRSGFITDHKKKKTHQASYPSEALRQRSSCRKIKDKRNKHESLRIRAEEEDPTRRRRGRERGR